VQSVRVRQHCGMLGSLLLRDSASEDEAGLLVPFGTGGGRKWKERAAHCITHLYRKKD